MKIGIAILVGVLVLLLGFIASLPQPVSANTLRSDIPTGAVNVADVGGGWVTFQWQGQCFLLQDKVATITTIACKATG